MRETNEHIVYLHICTKISSKGWKEVVFTHLGL